MIHRRFGGVDVFFTTRVGGVSTGPYRSFNLADHVGDDPGAVVENRRRLGGAVAAGRGLRWQWLSQVHGPGVVTVGRPAPRAGSGGPAGDASAPGRDPASPEAPEGDASVTAAEGVALAVLTADCAPVALAGRTAVSAVHAGWRGLEAGVVGAAVSALRDLDDGPVSALVGPCIRAHHNEFGAGDLDRLARRFGDGVRSRTPAGTPAFDLAGGVAVALARAGVEEIDDVGICTVCSGDLFSHRRDGVTGRQAMVVVR